MGVVYGIIRRDEQRVRLFFWVGAPEDLKDPTGRSSL